MIVSCLNHSTVSSCDRIGDTANFKSVSPRYRRIKLGITRRLEPRHNEKGEHIKRVLWRVSMVWNLRNKTKQQQIDRSHLCAHFLVFVCEFISLSSFYLLHFDPYTNTKYLIIMLLITITGWMRGHGAGRVFCRVIKYEPTNLEIRVLENIWNSLNACERIPHGHNSCRPALFKSSVQSAT